MTDGERIPKPAVLRPSEIAPRSRGGGVQTIPLVTRKVGSTGLINGITIIGPSSAVPMHSHNCEESVMVLSGRGFVEIDGVDHEVVPGDTTFLPANIPHCFKNASDAEEMRILWIYATIDATRTLIETGQTRTIDDEHVIPKT
jgi:quercetin dioxygenase-like cupin family protein